MRTSPPITLSLPATLPFKRGLGGALGALLLLLLVACKNTPADQARVEGHFEHLQQAQLFVYSDDAAFNRVDTVQIVGGDFSYSCTLHEPTVLTMVYPNFSETMLVAEPGHTLKYKADVSNLRHATISGTAANDSLSAFRQRYADKPLERQQRAAEQYIRQHPQDMASVALFIKYFERAEVHTTTTAQLLQTLVQAHPSHQGVQALSQRLRPLLRTAVGAQAPKDLTQGSLPAVLIFTLSTQYQSTELRRRAEEATADGSVRLEEIRADDRDLDSLRQRYGVRYIPGCIVIDAKGHIVARDLKPDKIAARVRDVKR